MNRLVLVAMLTASACLTGPAASASAAAQAGENGVARLKARETGSAAVTPGIKTLLAAQSPTNSYAVMFVDDGASVAYFYALDLARPQRPLVDSLHVYDVADRPPEKEWDVRLLWTVDGNAAALLVDGHPYAVFDFAKKRGYCRSGLPAPQLDWTDPHTWDERALELFR